MSDDKSALFLHYWQLLTAPDAAQPVAESNFDKDQGRRHRFDWAWPHVKVAVEVDGGSHCSLERKDQDRRKGEWLTGEGWTVLRFSNQEVMAGTAACARTVMSTTSKLRARTPTSSPAA